MALGLWAKTSGTWINALTVLGGTALGLLLQNRLSNPMQRILVQGVALMTVFIGFRMANSLTQAHVGQVDGVIVGLLAMILGGILGEWWQIEVGLVGFGNTLKRWFRGGSHFTDGFVAASLLFCIGPLTLIGSINNGLAGDNTLLVLKAALDGVAAIALTSSYGPGVGCSVLVILLYQGGISLAAGAVAGIIPEPNTDPRVALVTGVGGLMIIGLGLNLLEVTQIRISSFLPALLLAPPLYWLVQWVSP